MRTYHDEKDGDRDEDEMEDDDNDSKKGRNGDRLPRSKQLWATKCRKCIKRQVLCTARCALRKTKQARSKPPSSFLQCMVTDAILGPCSGNPWIQLLF